MVIKKRKHRTKKRRLVGGQALSAPTNKNNLFISALKENNEVYRYITIIPVKPPDNELVSLQQLSNAYNFGAQWCAAGWIRGQPNRLYYPMQIKDTWCGSSYGESPGIVPYEASYPGKSKTEFGRKSDQTGVLPFDGFIDSINDLSFYPRGRLTVGWPYIGTNILEDLINLNNNDKKGLFGYDSTKNLTISYFIIKGNICYISDSVNHVVFFVNLTTLIGERIAGNFLQANTITNDGLTTSLNTPKGLAINDSGDTLYICDTGNNRILKVFFNTTNTNLVSSTPAGYNISNPPYFLSLFFTLTGAYVGTSSIYYCNNFLFCLNNFCWVIFINQPVHIVIESALSGTNIFVKYISLDNELLVPRYKFMIIVSDQQNSKIDKFDSYITNRISTENILEVENSNRTLYGGYRIIGRQSAAGDSIEGFLGDGKYVNSSNPTIKFNKPSGIAMDSNDNLYICDSSNNRIRLLDRNGYINTIAGDGNTNTSNKGYALTVSLSNPAYVGIYNSNLLIINSNSSIIQQLREPIRNPTPVLTNNLPNSEVLHNYTITTLVGTGERGSNSSYTIGIDTLLNNPTGLAYDSLSNLYIADTSNHVILKMTPNNIISIFV
jgi:hypothetical protein